MAALATFFGVEAAFFTDDGYYSELERELAWLDAVHDEQVRRIAMRIVDLSPDARREVELKATELSRREGCEH
jgi:hypothetical protein